jgi:hypothetical protein
MNTRTYLANLRIAMVEELDKLPKHFCQPKVCLTATEPSICVTYLLQFGRHPAQGYVDECGLTLFLKMEQATLIMVHGSSKVMLVLESSPC